MVSFLQSVGIVVDDPELVTTSSGYKFFSFAFASRMKNSQSKDLRPVYFACSMDASKEKLVSFLKKGSRVVLNGELYCLDSYWSEKKQETVVKPKVKVLSVAFIKTLDDRRTETQEEKVAVSERLKPQIKEYSEGEEEEELPF